MCFLATHLQQSSDDRSGEIPGDETPEEHQDNRTTSERQRAENDELLTPSMDEFPTETSDNLAVTEGLA